MKKHRVAICVTGQHRVIVGEEYRYWDQGLSLLVAELEKNNCSVDVYETVWISEKHHELSVRPYHRTILSDELYESFIVSNMRHLRKQIPAKITERRPNLVVEKYTSNIHAQLYTFDKTLQSIKNSNNEYDIILRWRRDTFIREDAPADILVRPIIQFIGSDNNILTGAINVTNTRMLRYEDELFGVRYDFAMDLLDERSTEDRIVDIQRKYNNENRLDPHALWIEYFATSKNYTPKYVGSLYSYLGSYTGDYYMYDETTKSWIPNPLAKSKI